jgi:hypothetical protein
MKRLVPVFFALLSILFYQCEKDCKGISPTLSEDDKKWLSDLTLNDSLLFENNLGISKVFYVVEKRTEKIYDPGPVKVPRDKCKDYDVDFGTIKYSTLKQSLATDSVFLTLVIKRYADEKLATSIFIRDIPNEVAFAFDNPAPNHKSDVVPAIPMSKAIGQYEVNGKTYPDVQLYERDTTGLNPSDYATALRSVYYSKSAGLIKYEYLNHEVWLRKNQ